MPERTLAVERESWPIRGRFTISRGSKTAAEVVVVTLTDGDRRGRGECVPYSHYGETVEEVMAEIESHRAALQAGLSRAELQTRLAAGAARNAVDCALWDLEAKTTRRPVAARTGLAPPRPRETAYTISLGSPEEMAKEAADAADRPLLKLKLGGEGDAARVRAVRAAVPATRLIVDANEAWTADMLKATLPEMARLGVELVEQPLPAGEDGALGEISHAVRICADESFHDLATLDDVAPLYDGINIKLDKTGGLTEAIRVANAARQRNLVVMVGCMIGTSLAMAPATMLSGVADYVDLDGPLLLARDREPGLEYRGSVIYPADAALWG